MRSEFCQLQRSQLHLQRPQMTLQQLQQPQQQPSTKPMNPWKKNTSQQLQERTPAILLKDQEGGKASRHPDMIKSIGANQQQRRQQSSLRQLLFLNLSYLQKQSIILCTRSSG